MYSGREKGIVNSNTATISVARLKKNAQDLVKKTQDWQAQDLIGGTQDSGRKTQNLVERTQDLVRKTQDSVKRDQDSARRTQDGSWIFQDSVGGTRDRVQTKGPVTELDALRSKPPISGYKLMF